MGVAVELYLGRDRKISFVDIFASQGFQVTVSARRLADGSSAAVYKYAQGKERFALILFPVRENPHYTAIRLLARARHSAVMISAKEILQGHGALTPAQYDAARMETHWKRVIQRLFSTEASDRNWAAHVLATKFPPSEKSNLANALEHCDRAALIAHLEDLDRNDPNSTIATYAREILQVLDS